MSLIEKLIDSLNLLREDQRKEREEMARRHEKDTEMLVGIIQAVLNERARQREEGDGEDDRMLLPFLEQQRGVEEEESGVGSDEGQEREEEAPEENPDQVDDDEVDEEVEDDQEEVEEMEEVEEHDRSDVDSDDVEEFEPPVQFRPVVALPDLVDVWTGEEDEDVFFEEHCAFFRFDAETKQWRERGSGIIKVLQNQKTPTISYRVVMRRDQVHTICTNFRIVGGMVSSQIEKTVFWICSEYLDGEYKYERLAARFRSELLAREFRAVFTKAVEDLGDTPARSQLRKRKIVLPEDSTNDATEDGEPAAKSAQPSEDSANNNHPPGDASGASSGAAASSGDSGSSGDRSGTPGASGACTSQVTTAHSQIPFSFVFSSSSSANQKPIHNPQAILGPRPRSNETCAIYNYDRAVAALDPSYSIFGGLRTILTKDSPNVSPPSDPSAEQKKNAPSTSSAAEFSFVAASSSSSSGGASFVPTKSFRPFNPANQRTLNFGPGFGFGKRIPRFANAVEIAMANAAAAKNDESKEIEENNKKPEENQEKKGESSRKAAGEERKVEGEEEILFEGDCFVTRFYYARTFAYGETREMQKLGDGMMKILKHKASGIYRISMPRETVPSINIPISKEVEFKLLRHDGRDVMLKFAYVSDDGKKSSEMLGVCFISEIGAQLFAELVKEGIAAAGSEEEKK